MKRRRGIYLLPNLLTTAGLFAGFYGVVAAMDSHFEAAAIAVFVAMVMDGMDGRIARLTNTQSAFGGEYDSLTDMVSFGIAPALIVYQWALAEMGKLGWLVAFIYAACTALRLARFNAQASSEDKYFFQGLPSPAAAALIASMIWLGELHQWIGITMEAVAFIFTIASSILMVSNIRYHSFKQIDFSHRVPFIALLAILLLFVGIAIRPPLMLFLTALFYALSGLALTLWQIHQRRLTRKSTDDTN